jgi:dUTP pyrophosphatase
MRKINLQAEVLKNAKDFPLPSYQTNGASGMDLFAAVKKRVLIKKGSWKLIPTGLKIKIPKGYELQIRPRSGLALKNGITLLNTPGTIDSDYRGEIKIIMINFGKKDFIVKRGDRIAQMVLCKVEKGIFKKVKKIPRTKRNPEGFGTTGL